MKHIGPRYDVLLILLALGSMLGCQGVSVGGKTTTQATSPEGGQLSVSAVGVGSVSVGKSGTGTGTLSVTGASVAVSGVTLSGANSSEFSISGISFPATVASNQPVNFTVTFTPQAGGGASANVSFASNASVSPSSAALSGTGVAPNPHTVNLSWNASNSPNVVSYNIYRATFTAACGAYSRIGSSGITSFADSSVVNGQAYCYQATAVNSSEEESGDSTPVQDIAIPSS